MEAAAMTAGPVRNLTAIEKAAVEFPHAMILGCKAMNRPVMHAHQKHHHHNHNNIILMKQSKHNKKACTRRAHPTTVYLNSYPASATTVSQSPFSERPT